MMNKKADIGLGIILVIIIIVIFLGWLVNEGWKECRADNDCKQNQYCTSQFTCKDIPVREKFSPSAPVSDDAAWILGVALVIAALILKFDSVVSFIGGIVGRLTPHNKKEPEQKKSGAAAHKDDYIDLTKKYNAEKVAHHEKDLDRQTRI